MSNLSSIGVNSTHTDDETFSLNGNALTDLHDKNSSPEIPVKSEVARQIEFLTDPLIKKWNS